MQIGCALCWLEASGCAGPDVGQARSSGKGANLQQSRHRASLLSLSFRSQPPGLPLTLAGIPSLSVPKSVKSDNAICLEGLLDRSDEVTRMKRTVPSVFKNGKNRYHLSRAVRPSRRARQRQQHVGADQLLAGSPP